MMPQLKNEKRKSAIHRMENAISRYNRTLQYRNNADEYWKEPLKKKIRKLEEIISNTRRKILYGEK